MSSPAPIILTVYDRLGHLERCIEALRENDLAKESVLYIASDGPADQASGARIEAVRAFIQTIDGFKKVVPLFRDGNLGAARSAEEARELVLRDHDSFIRMEDDILASKSFLQYLNEGLERYEDDESILAICAYHLPIRVPAGYEWDVYLGKRFSPWGYAMWKDRLRGLDLTRWDRYGAVVRDKRLVRLFESVGKDILQILEMDSNGKIVANDVRICYQQLLAGQYCIFPTRSLSRNIGMDGSGIHSGVSRRFDVELNIDAAYPRRWPGRPEPNAAILRRFRSYQDGTETPLRWIWMHFKQVMKAAGLAPYLRRLIPRSSMSK